MQTVVARTFDTGEYLMRQVSSFTGPTQIAFHSGYTRFWRPDFRLNTVKPVLHVTCVRHRTGTA